MKDLLIYQVLQSMSAKFPEWDIDWYIGTLLDYEEDVWFTPTNNSASDYDICLHLSELKLIEVVSVPKWSYEGQFRGVQTQFRYKKDLQY